jgi:excisionase family DNA binding protein
MSEKLQEVFTPEQAAEYLQVNRETIYRYIRDGKLIASKLGRTYRVTKRNLELLLWATRTREDVTLREYMGEESTAFMEDDKLNEGSSPDTKNPVDDSAPAEGKEMSDSEFLLSIAGIVSSGTTDTSERIEEYVTEIIKQKYS